MRPNVWMDRERLLKSQMLRREQQSYVQLLRQQQLADTLMVGTWILVSVVAVVALWIC